MPSDKSEILGVAYLATLGVALATRMLCGTTTPLSSNAFWASIETKATQSVAAPTKQTPNLIDQALMDYYQPTLPPVAHQPDLYDLSF